jgi:hypothetical protein
VVGLKAGEYFRRQVRLLAEEIGISWLPSIPVSPRDRVWRRLEECHRLRYRALYLEAGKRYAEEEIAELMERVRQAGGSVKGDALARRVAEDWMLEAERQVPAELWWRLGPDERKELSRDLAERLARQVEALVSPVAAVRRGRPKRGRPKRGRLSSAGRAELRSLRHDLIMPLWEARNHKNCEEWAREPEKNAKHRHRVSARTLEDWLEARVVRSHRQTLEWIVESTGIAADKLP